MMAHATWKPRSRCSAWRPSRASALFLGIFCSGICFIIQSVEQQFTTVSHAGLIFTLEPAFSAVFAFFLLGDPRLSRVVGYALHANPEPGVIPCHRVVKRDGEVSSAFAFGGANRQVELLRAEGVAFADGSHVDMARCRSLRSSDGGEARQPENVTETALKF